MNRLAGLSRTMTSSIVSQGFPASIGKFIPVPFASCPLCALSWLALSPLPPVGPARNRDNNDRPGSRLLGRLIRSGKEEQQKESFRGVGCSYGS